MTSAVPSDRNIARGMLPLGVANLAAHRRDQVEPLQCDEGVPHGLRKAGESLREEGSEAIGQLAGRGGLGEEHEEPGDNDHRENDDLPIVSHWPPPDAERVRRHM